MPFDFFVLRLRFPLSVDRMGCSDWFLFKEDARATIRKTHDFLQVQTEKTFGSGSSVLSCSHFVNFLKTKPPDCDTIFAIRAVDSF